MIKALVEKYQNNLAVSLPFVLLNYRECQVESLLLYPYELLSGRFPTDPLSLLMDTWLSKPVNKLNKQNMFNYIMKLRDKIDNIMQKWKKKHVY